MDQSTFEYSAISQPVFALVCIQFVPRPTFHRLVIAIRRNNVPMRLQSMQILAAFLAVFFSSIQRWDHFLNEKNWKIKMNAQKRSFGAQTSHLGPCWQFKTNHDCFREYFNKFDGQIVLQWDLRREKCIRLRNCRNNWSPLGFMVNKSSIVK